VRQAGTELFGPLRDARDLVARHQHAELLAAEPRHQRIAAGETLPQPRRHLAQAAIARRVPVAMGITERRLSAGNRRCRAEVDLTPFFWFLSYG